MTTFITKFARSLIVAVFCWAAATPAGLAKDAAAPAHEAAMKLPEPLTKDSIRELVSRLDDAEVRKLLIAQLDRSAKAPAAKPPDEMAAMAQTTSEEFAQLRARAAAVVNSAGDFPVALGQVAVRMTEGRDTSLLWVLAAWFLAMLGVGLALEFAFARLTRGVRRRFDERTVAGFVADAVQVLLRGGIGLAGIVVFAAGALGLFFAFWQGYESTRFVVLVGLSAVLAIRVVALIARLLLEPRAPQLRLLPFDDRAARTLYWGIVRLAVLYAVIRVTMVLLTRFGAPADSIVLFGSLSSALFVALMLDTIWRVRADVARLIRGPGEPGHLRRLLADLWPALAAVYLLGIYVARLHEQLLGKSDTSQQGVLSVVLLLALPLVDMLLCRAFDAAMSRPAMGEGEVPGASLAESFGPVLRRAIHVVVLVSGFLILADLWDLNMFVLAERGLGGKIAEALLGIAITTLLAWIMWEVALTAIDRRMTGPVDSERPASRLRTLLPLLRMTVQATILVMAILSILAALGINIVPLLAGASVVGVAIGFGSQTLVRDIVSGGFFLMDDAFRLGEYIEVGDAKGTVEKIGVRSVILRHHRGALNVLPYGEIKRLRNTSRDWMIMTLEFPLAYDTDLKKVKQIIRSIGEELADDPEMASGMIEPLKSQGVQAANDGALVVRAKFMANPIGGAAYLVRREAYARIVRAFAEAGIRFAQREVTVTVPPGAAANVPAIAGAAAFAGAEALKR